jgi:tryptophan synthase alpha chain
MSRRLNDLIEKKNKAGEKLLSIFITAGFPEKNATADIVFALAESGVDFIELGMPFSDPIADGPVIQSASQKALDNGITLEFIFDILREIRAKTDIPVILMGYINPVMQFGLDEFIQKSAKLKVDGLILPDWPLEENSEYAEKFKENDLDLIHLIAPNTPKNRILQIDQQSTSFIYCVAYTGVTGQNNQITNESAEFLNYLKNNLNQPFVVGFGVKNHEDFIRYGQYANGVIIGSAFIRLVENTAMENRYEAVKEFVKKIKS